MTEAGDLGMARPYDESGRGAPFARMSALARSRADQHNIGADRDDAGGEQLFEQALARR